MNTATALLLLIGTILAVFGITAYANGDGDPETLRLARLAAVYGRRTAAVALAAWILAGAPGGSVTTLLVSAAAAAIGLTYGTSPAWRAAA